MIDLIIDTDSAIDDWWAILFLLMHPEVNVLAITVVATGEAHGLAGAKNIAKLCALVGKLDIPIAYGQAKPLSGDNAFPDDIRKGVDRMMRISLPDHPNPCIGDNAVELLRQTLSRQSATVLAIGPHTNLAKFCKDHSKLWSKIERLVVMGGAVKAGGNIKILLPNMRDEDDVAEWNIYCDPLAAKIVFDSGVPIELVPLDLTNDHPIKPDFVDAVNARREYPCLDFVAQTFERIRVEWGDNVADNGCYYWDIVAAFVVLLRSHVSSDVKGMTVDETTGQIIVGAAHQSVKQITSLQLSNAEFIEMYLGVFKPLCLPKPAASSSVATSALAPASVFFTSADDDGRSPQPSGRRPAESLRTAGYSAGTFFSGVLPQPPGRRRAQSLGLQTSSSVTLDDPAGTLPTSSGGIETPSLSASNSSAD